MSTPGVAIVNGNMVMITGYPVIVVVIIDDVKAAEPGDNLPGVI